MQIPAVLSIAGSDCSGGAGIQADLKTMLCCGVYGMSAITALTAQNTLGVQAVEPVAPAFLAQQLDSVFSDISPDAVKVGMLVSAEHIRVIADRLTHYKAKNIVIDPVFMSTSGTALLDEAAMEVLCSELLPLASVVTPNIPEAQVLAGMTISNGEEMEKAAALLSRRFGCAVLLKGGHSSSVSSSDDYLFAGGRGFWYKGERIPTRNSHGTGCTLSSAIAGNLAKGMYLSSAVSNAKSYLIGTLASMLDLGAGNGPVDHGYMLHRG